MLSHATHHVGALPPAFARLMQSGDNGVKLFFMASALTLFLSMDSRRRESRPVRNFFLRRFFRIAPLFYAGVVFYTVWNRGVPIEPTAAQTITPASVLATLTFTNGWSPAWINQVVPGGWSIAVEMNFYLLVPILYAMLPNLTRTVWLTLGAQLLTWSSAMAISKLLAATNQCSPGAANAFVSWWLPAQAPLFLFGVIVYFLIRDELRGLPRSEASTFPIDRQGALYLHFTAVYSYLAFVTHEPLKYVPIIPILLLMLVLALARNPVPLFVNPISRYLGKISFSAYLCHFAMLQICAALVDTEILAFARAHWAIHFTVLMALTLVSTMAVSAATYHLIEVPGQECGKRLIRWLESRSADRAPSLADAAATNPSV
jgi:peptidoglycan/LPS O-acetylase OafA/YrhL